MKNVKIKLLASVMALSFSGMVTARNAKPLYKDASQSVENRVADLMSRMTLEEKVAQMCQYVGPDHIRASQAKFKGKAIESNDDTHGFYKTLSVNELLKLVAEGKVGSFLNVTTAKESNELQKLAMKSRLQIPLLNGIDAIHGAGLCYGTTVYPTPIGQAATFDVDLIEQLCKETALEVRATGSHWTFTPNVDVARDARWGRVGETFGEDPYLVTQMGLASVKGFQGKNLSEPGNVLSCAKHLIAGSEPTTGTNAAPMDVSMRTLREIYLPPYKALVEAGVTTMMAAHNDLNGIPCHINKLMMDEIVRKEYGFNGFIVSDWLDMERLHNLHMVASSLGEAFSMSVDAGVDMHMHGPGFYERIIDSVKEGKLSEKAVDRACSLILAAKFRLGLFENPFIDLKQAAKTLHNEKHVATSLKVAEESIVLLKNENLLPLDFSKYKHILVTGPNANNPTMLGDWAYEQPEENIITALEGLQEVAGKDKIVYYDYGEDIRQNSPEKVTAAAALARKSDLAIVVVGENSIKHKKKLMTCGENVDRMTLDLLGSQEDLVKAIHQTGVPTVVVVVTGRPLSVNWISENVPALIQAWEPGAMGGKALANILSGKVNPSAKLPISIPRHSGQIQMIYNHKNSQYFHKYIDGPSTPLYPFGYGLSYTQFEISAPQVAKAKLTATEDVEVSVEVENRGKYEGTEVVQLYIHDKYSSATRAVKELKDFVRVTLKPGEKKTIRFMVTPDKLAYYNKDMVYGVEKGEFEIMVGSSSSNKDLKKTTIEVI